MIIFASHKNKMLKNTNLSISSSLLLKLLLVLPLLYAFSACDIIIPPVENPDLNDSIPSDTIPTDTIPYNPVPTDGLAYIFDIHAVPEITLEVTADEWNKLLTYYDQNPHNEEYVRGNFVFLKNGERISLSNVGLRIRGNSSRRRPEGKTGEMHNSVDPDWHHASFALNFKKYVKGQKFAGTEKLNLKWFKDDATYAREVYCYDLFERFGVWTAPQSSYCRLTIRVAEDKQAVYYGVYQLVESVDKEYVKNRLSQYTDSNGNLWKANYGADFISTDRSRMGLENITLTQTYEPVYDLKTNEENLETAKNQLVDFISNLNSKTGDSFKAWISEKMDVELFLRTYAVNVMCGMWDDYWNNKNNFYFYFDSAGKFYFIPYDYDNTLGTSFLMDDSGKRDVLNWGKSSHPLVKKIISIPEYKTLYVGYIKELCDPKNDLFHVDKSIVRIQNWQNKIRLFVPNDTGEDMEIADRPASWGNCSHYRLLDANNNYFKIRAAHIPL